jgi:hypothetical protein
MTITDADGRPISPAPYHGTIPTASRGPKPPKEGHAEINSMIRKRFARSTESERVMQEFDRREEALGMREPSPPVTESNAARAAGLDQGARGGAQAPLKGNDLINDRLRKALRGEEA